MNDLSGPFLAAEERPTPMARALSMWWSAVVGAGVYRTDLQIVRVITEVQ